MSLFDFLLLEANHSKRIQKLKRSQSKSAQRGVRARGRLERRVEELESDVGFLTLVLAALMAEAEESGSLSRDGLLAKIRAVDGFDGLEDGRLDIGLLRGSLEDEGPPAEEERLPELP